MTNDERRVFEPHPYQREAIRRIIEDRSVGLFMDMGLGKTAVTLTAIDALIYDYLAVWRALVIAPKKVAEATWQAEAAKWAHLGRLSLATALGSPKERDAAIRQQADVTIINRENVEWLVERYWQVWPFDMVVVDESSSFKSPAAKRFKALRRMLPKIERVVILTGTPAPNGLEDLWSQIYLLDRGERLGRYVTHFRARYFDYNPWAHRYTPKPGAFEAVQAKISDICVSMQAGDWLQLPERVIHDVPVALDESARKAYRELERTMCLEVGEEEISAMSAAGLTNKLLQLCGGSVYDESGEAHAVHTAKLEALAELVEALGEPCLLFYGFRHELPGIEAALKGRRVRRLETARDADDWNAGAIDVLLAHPASCAYGLNLQQGGRHVVWYTLTWSLELYQQANARLYRQGQQRPVVIHRLLVSLRATPQAEARISGGSAGERALSPCGALDEASMDEDVAKALEGKDETQAVLIEALKARIRGYAG